jgi:hypothetical protein
MSKNTIIVQNMWAYRTITHNRCPHINAELLLVPNNDDTATTPASLNGCSGPQWGVKACINLMEAILRTYYKCTL